MHAVHVCEPVPKKAAGHVHVYPLRPSTQLPLPQVWAPQSSMLAHAPAATWKPAAHALHVEAPAAVQVSAVQLATGEQATHVLPSEKVPAGHVQV